MTAPGSGLGVDIHGGPVVDPTKNVLDLVTAAVTRLDDMTALRAELSNEKARSLRREAKWQAKVGALRANHQTALDALEAKRLDAIRQVDQLAVKTEADRSAAAITALATSAATTAETLRNAVNTSATNLATQLTNTVNSITERIASLEKLSYTGQGRQAVVDPQMTDISMELRKLVAVNASHTGKVEGVDTTWKLLIAGVGLIATLSALGVFTRSAPAVQPVSTAPPQIYYQPAAPGTLLPTQPMATPR